MVWVSDEMTVDAIITGSITNGKKRCTIQLSPSKEVESIFSEAARDFQCQSEDINFVLQINDNLVFLDNYRDKRLNDIGVVLEPNSRPVLVGSVNIRNKTIVAGDSSTSEDALALGASASPTSGCGMNVNSDSCSDIFCYTSDDDFQQWRTLGQSKTNQSTMKPYVKDTDVPLLELPCNYVGLVNQAMTCYLNSLLQALYMTPEFRNALYNWEFDGQNETRSIPFQLQKLFLNLQTSSKSAVETTDLTTSFGWQGSEAWHQHDIQELCRVMFDALEQKFKDTKQANLINDLYEGKMLDYVKCLECGTEKSREDAFLDIPLPVRPFGSIVAYNSVEEALRAFVQYETLEGSNQYYCEKCNKKCDAHKGLKFIKFPYLLTLHLKRFDFDYNTMLRIKLNDKVVFPAVLNLNYFIPVTNLENEVSEDRETVVKCDDCSTTDSGSALDDESCHGTDTSCTVNGQDVNSQDEDEGIDMGMGGQENEKNRNHEPKGPYVYELFSIMIHSGSASGGHYYAYIKDFQSNMWYCFNDQSVSRITEDDIKKTYGGSSTRSHYSGAYSTNAYMLMYRQIDKERNCLPMSVEDFPPHIKKLLKDMKEKEESDRINKEKENDMVTLRVYCYHPIKNRLVDVKVVTFIDSDLQEAVKDVYDRLKLDGVVKLEDCRLVSYNKSIDCIECSFDDELIKFCDLGRKLNLISNDWLLEIKKPGTHFKVHKRGGVKMKVYMVNLDTEDLDGPVILRVNPEETVGEFKQVLADMLDLVASTVKLAQEMLNNPPQYLDDDSEPLKFDPNFPNCYKMYVTTALLDNDPDKECLFSNQFLKVVERFANVICLNVTLPETDIVTLENLSIPPLDLNQNLDKVDMGAGDRLTNSPNLTVSPRPGSTGCMEGFGDQSNSEDSSLSDSDRTLVGDAPGDCLALLSSSSDSPADQHMASPSDPAEDTYNHEIFSSSYGEMHWDNEEAQDISHNSSRCYFKAVPITTYSSEDVDTDAPRLYKVLLDKYMTLGQFKKHIEPIVGVPVEYFKFFRRYNSQDSDIEWTSLTDNFVTCKDGDCVMIKLGRVLKKDEFIGKVFLLAPNNSSEPFKFLFEHIFSKGQTVGSARKEIILQAKKQHMLDVPYNRSRLRKKCWKMAAKVLLDDQKFDDISVGSNFEVCLQELPGPEKVTSINQLVLFVRRWRPSTLTLDPVHEVVLDECLVSDLYRKISEESGIPVVNLEIAYQKNSFPCDINVLSVNELEWDPTVYSLRDCPFQVYDDGHIFLYRDSREELKELTPEERKEIQQRENSRLGVYNYRDNRLSRRERALVIHVDDNSPSKSNDTSGD